MKIYEWGRRGDPALLYWDGLGGTGLHANEIGPILAAEYGLHVIAPDPPGHGRTPAPEADAFRPSRLAAAAAELLTELGVERAAFVGFSWGGRVGCWFAASFPERTTCLALVEGGHHGSLQPTGLEAAIAEARAEREDETFESWDAYLAYERESLRRWTPDARRGPSGDHGGGGGPHRAGPLGRSARGDQPGQPARARRGGLPGDRCGRRARAARRCGGARPRVGRALSGRRSRRRGSRRSPTRSTTWSRSLPTGSPASSASSSRLSRRRRSRSAGRARRRPRRPAARPPAARAPRLRPVRPPAAASRPRPASRAAPAPP